MNRDAVATRSQRGAGCSGDSALCWLFAVCLALQALAGNAVCVAGDQPPAAVVHPRLLFSPQDRTRILAEAGLDPASWTPETIPDVQQLTRKTLQSWAGSNYERHLRMDYIWEGPRSEAMLRLAMLGWFAGRDFKRPESKGQTPDKEMRTIVDAIRNGIKGMSMPDGRQSDRIKGPGTTDRWGRLLEASTVMWTYALTYDFLSSPELKAAGLEEAMVQEYYRKFADGIFRIFVAHLRSIQGPDSGWGKSRPIGNNWNSREFAAIGMACLAFQDRLMAEPGDSQRRKDYEDGLDGVRRLSTEYLEGWAESGDKDASYYYESPHYFRYWIDTFLPFARAHERVFPELRAKWPALSTGPDGPMARFMRAQARFIMPTHFSREGKAQWTAPPWDDSWLYCSDTGIPMAIGAAWLPGDGGKDRETYLDTLAYCGEGWTDMLVGSGIWDEMEKLRRNPRPLPKTQAIWKDGLALVRTGSDTGDLTVAVKNNRTPMNGVEPAPWGHAHADNGQVLAYRNAEAILVDPGYGSEGFSNKQHVGWFCNWNRHNVLLVEDEKGYSDKLRELVMDNGRFVLPVWKDGGPEKRITRCEELKDEFGGMLVMETTLPTHDRLVIVADRSHLLVVDRLKEAKRIKLCWWGNGSVDGRDNPPNNKGVRRDGDADKRSTARIDAGKAQGTYFRGPSLSTRISVAWPTANETQIADSEYGPWWGAMNLPLSGMHVVSAKPTRCAVTLVELADMTAGKEGRFALSAQVTTGDDGRLREVRVDRDGKADRIYVFTDDGGFLRHR